MGQRYGFESRSFHLGNTVPARWYPRPKPMSRLIVTHGDLTRGGAVEGPIKRIADRFVADWVKGVTHPRNDDSVGTGHFRARDTEGKMKWNEAVISSVDDGQGNSAGHSLRDGTGWLSRIPFWVDAHVGMAFGDEPAEVGAGQNDRDERADSKRNSPIGWTRDHDNPCQF